jgi:predicted transcriptional regulator
LHPRALPRLGELERAVLGHLWSHGPADVKAVHRALGAARGIAPNTVQSTLDRLFRKGLADRTKLGRAHHYRARITRAEWLARTLAALAEAVPGAEPRLLLAGFVDFVERAGGVELAELERLVRERRRRAGGGGP